MAIGTLYIVAAPSGAGKSSMIGAYLNRNRKYPAQVSVSHTTREPRPGEEDGIHYHFVDHASFEAKIAQNDFFEYAQVFGNYYGTSRATIESCLSQGIDVFLDIDWQGARQVKALMPEAVSVFILPPSRHELEQRLHMRGQDSADVIAKRMQEAHSEMSHFDEFDYVIVNKVFDEAVNQLQAIVIAQRLRYTHQRLAQAKTITDLLGDQ
ncbi:guanylate kinase [Alginatibacterium sediminis]|uniref:Guanylate kinase n=1 Tax=Alginatibacterium sediminis TaxID=2164068 RepID=A0A420ENE0_9ALTE|nr:guanylate kinase [Alginatibacterium sediminis]RKF22116.1 guanylate kinase [Alginatibacterium sediminis]